MKRRIRILRVWVLLILAVLTPACDIVDPPDMCVDWTDTGNSCQD